MAHGNAANFGRSSYNLAKHCMCQQGALNNGGNPLASLEVEAAVPTSWIPPLLPPLLPELAGFALACPVVDALALALINL